jgi:site-specific DNA recombinase
MKIAGYARVSTADQIDNTSLEDQKRIVEDRCQKEGHELYQFYSDEGVSGGSLQRPALQKLIADAKAKRFEAVYFTKLDRLGRSVRDIANLYHDLHEECGIGLVCIDDPSLNTTGKMGSVTRGILSTFAQFERDMIRERTTAGRAAKWARGEIVIGELPFGYQKNETTGKPEIVEYRAAIYQKIVGYYLDQRLSMKDIALRLTKEHIPTPLAQKVASRLTKKKKSPTESKAQKVKKIPSEQWNSITVGDILKQPAYKGEAIYNQQKPEAEWIKIPFPPLIPEDRWRQIQDRIQTQRHKPKRIFKDYADHFLLDGFIYCGECGSRMRKRVKMETDRRNGKTRLYYVCYWRGSTAKEKEIAGRTSSCNLKAVNADVVDEQLFDQIVDMLTGPDKYVEAWMKDLNADELSEKVCVLEKKEKELHNKLVQGFQFIASQPNPEVKKIYTEELKKWQHDWESILPELQHAQADFEIVKNKVDRYQQFKEAIRNAPLGSRLALKFKTKAEFQKHMLALPFPEKRRIVEAIVSPENGGKCSVGYVRPVDFLDYEELKSLSADERRKPLDDKSTYVNGNFSIDLSKIEAIINGLDREDILSKAHPRPFSGRQENAY